MFFEKLFFKKLLCCPHLFGNRKLILGRRLGPLELLSIITRRARSEGSIVLESLLDWLELLVGPLELFRLEHRWTELCEFLTNLLNKWEIDLEIAEQGVFRQI